MADAFIIEVSDIAAGIVTAHRNRFQFYAAHSISKSLEGRTFKSLKAAQLAVEQVVAAKTAKWGVS
jgi:hypothetical protein